MRARYWLSLTLALMLGSIALDAPVAAAAPKPKAVKCGSAKINSFRFTHITATDVSCNYVTKTFLPQVTSSTGHLPKGWKATKRATRANPLVIWQDGKKQITYDAVPPS